ncbi:uncharacterized protein LOC126824394 [Patella vulgata]|uniref:uncharacterized protein LOC126824394 n=1 Tax=Patella vulgata TaxID=6465 RepID=UPI00217FD84B|nr:uncharacterized protein LOC126824394 [Patella vulgata]
MLSELDSPGEYYVDRSAGILYLWPNTHSGTIQSSDVVYASIIKDCISLSHGVSNIKFEGFTLEACRHYGITADGGHNLKFTNLEVKNTGTFGISCGNDCRSTTISKCDIHDTDGAIKISGGDRKNLISSGNIIEDNRLWNFGRATAVGADGIALGGVNTIIRNNYIHHGTYSCIKWSGNDHIMENNHFHDCCHATSDCGAIHSGRDWTSRGTVIRNNYIHNTVRHWPGAEIRGVMLDDQFSGANIEHNIFALNEVHVNIGGGRDTMIYYNVFYDSSSAAIDVDGRGISGGTNTATLENTLKGVPYAGALWASKYPTLAAMAHSKNHGAPEGRQQY